MPFTVDHAGIRQLARSPQVTAYLRTVAEKGARDIEEVAPSIVTKNGEVRAESNRGEARIVVKSPFWHWPEYGGTNFAHRPYIRPTFARLMAQFGGRLDSTGRFDG